MASALLARSSGSMALYVLPAVHNLLPTVASGLTTRFKSSAADTGGMALKMNFDEETREFTSDGSMTERTVPNKHPSLLRHEKGDSYMLMNPVYPEDYLHKIQPSHLPPVNVRDSLALGAIQSVRWVFDKLTGYGPDMNEAKWLQRMLFLETVAGVPGMVAGMLRHLRSLRTMKRDHGWIHTLLEEAENERMHLLTFLQLRQPGIVFRTNVILAQGLFFNAYFLTYMVSPKYCHRLVGYLEEEAVKTYTHCLNDIDSGKLPEWTTKEAPEIAKAYWKLAPDATMKDVILAVRADEACHSHVNHTFADMGGDDTNPFQPGTHIVA